MPLLKYTVYLFSLSGVMKSLECFQTQELLCDFQHLWTTEPPWWFLLCCLLEALMNNSLYILSVPAIFLGGGGVQISLKHVWLWIGVCFIAD